MSDADASFGAQPSADEPDRDDLGDPGEVDTDGEQALREAEQDPAVEEPRATPDAFPDAEDLPESQGDGVSGTFADDEEH